MDLIYSHVPYTRDNMHPIHKTPFTGVNGVLCMGCMLSVHGVVSGAWCLVNRVHGILRVGCIGFCESGARYHIIV